MICRLCGKSFLISEMSEEHYPAHSVGNDDIVKLDLVKMIDSIQSSEISNRVKTKSCKKVQLIFAMCLITLLIPRRYMMT